MSIHDETNQNNIYGNTQAPVGFQQSAGDYMVAAPTNFSLADAQGIANQQITNGYAPDTREHDARVTADGERLAAMMASRGATNEEIRQAVGSMPGVTVDNQNAVLIAANNAAESQRNPLAAMVAEASDKSTVIGTLIGAGLVAEAVREERANPLVAERLDQRPFGEQLAALGGEFVPGSSPNAGMSQGREMGGRFA